MATLAPFNMTDAPTMAPTFEPYIYSQSFRAEFMHFRSPTLCSGDDPTIRVYCYGGSFRIDDTSDNIQCADESQFRPNSEWQFIECNSTCTTDECRESTFLNVNGRFADGPFAHVDFTCAGNLLANVNAGMEYMGGEPGICSTFTESSLTANYHIARLAVECPTENGGREFVIDDHYTECASSVPFTLDFEAGNEYSCFEGGTCEETFCEIEFDDFFINADLPLFAHQCTESLVPIPAPTPPAPSPGTSTENRFDTQFVAGFGIFFGDENCSGNAPKLTVTCPLGTLEFIDTSYSSTSCTPIGNSAMECTDSTNAIDQFAEVTYNCTGFTEQDSYIEFAPNDAFCEGLFSEAEVSHRAYLGLTCDIGEGPEMFFNDLLVECGSVTNEFAFNDQFGGDQTPRRFTCLERVFFPVGSTTSDTQSIGLVKVMTDPDWLTDPIESCRHVRLNVPTSAPSESPTLAPVRGPTQEPSAAPVALSAPTPRGDASPSSSSSSVPLGPIIGGAVGAIAIIAAAAIAAIFIRSRGNRPKPESQKDQVYYEEEPQHPQDPSNTAGASESGHNDYVYNDRYNNHNPYNMYGREAGAAASSAPSTRTNTSGNASAYSGGASSHRTPDYSARTPDYSHRTPDYSAPGRPLQFKDQTRTVIEVPTVDGVPTNQPPPDDMPMAGVAMPMMDVSEVTDNSGDNNTRGNRSGNANSRGSDEPRRRQLEP